MRNSKIFSAETRASVSATSNAVLFMPCGPASAIAFGFYPVAARAILALYGGQGEAELLFHCACQEAAHTVLLPFRRLHYLVMLAPSVRLSRVSTRSCLVVLGSSDVLLCLRAALPAVASLRAPSAV